MQGRPSHWGCTAPFSWGLLEAACHVPLPSLPMCTPDLAFSPDTVHNIRGGGAVVNFIGVELGRATCLILISLDMTPIAMHQEARIQSDDESKRTPNEEIRSTEKHPLRIAGKHVGACHIFAVQLASLTRRRVVTDSHKPYQPP